MFLKMFLKDITKFDAQNPIIGSLLSEIESRKLTDESVKNFLDKAQNLEGIKLNQKLQNLKFCNNKLQLNNNNDNDSSDYYDNGSGFLSPPAQLLHHSSNSNTCFLFHLFPKSTTKFVRNLAKNRLWSCNLQAWSSHERRGKTSDKQ